MLNRNTNGNITVYFELLPFACLLERCEQDVELGETCSSLLAMISQALTLSDCMGVALQKISEVSLMSSWSARLAVIDLLQVLVFNNMSIVLSRDEWVAEVQLIVLRLLEDSVLEVREKAAQVSKKIYSLRSFSQRKMLFLRFSGACYIAPFCQLRISSLNFSKRNAELKSSKAHPVVF